MSVRWVRRRGAALGMTMFAALLVVAGCSGSSDDSATALSGAAQAETAPMADAPASDDGSAGGGATAYSYDSGDFGGDDFDSDMAGEEPPRSPGGPSSAPLDRQIIRTAQLSIEISVPHQGTRETTRAAQADAAAEAATKIRALASAPGGYVSASDGSGAVVTVTLRIPSERYSSVLERIGELGRVTAIDESTSDVTDQLVDLGSRITSMRTSVDRLRTLLAEADSVADLISVESELTRREADLDSLLARQAQLKDLVSLSTVTVTIEAVAESAATADEPERSAFARGLADGWNALVSFGSWLAVVTGALLPFSPLLLIVLIGALWWARRRVRRLPATPAAESAGDTADEPAAPAAAAASSAAADD